MKAREVMTRKVWKTTLDTPVRKAVQMMIARKVSALPVVDSKGRLVGIVSEGDLLRRSEIGTEWRSKWWSRLLGDVRDDARRYVKSQGGHVGDIMTRPVVSVTPTTDVRDVVELLESSGIKRVPVVDGAKVVGILSRRDILRAMGRVRARRRVKVSDLALRERLQNKLDAQSWASGLIINFIVERGRVELFGLVDSRDQRDAIKVLAENTPGVRSVKDLLAVSTRTPGYT